jgi:hypothetical protein
MPVVANPELYRGACRLRPPACHVFLQFAAARGLSLHPGEINETAGCRRIGPAACPGR